jgi:hypothetical protein
MQIEQKGGVVDKGCFDGLVFEKGGGVVRTKQKECKA